MGVFTLFVKALWTFLRLLLFINKSFNPLIKNRPQLANSETVEDFKTAQNSEIKADFLQDFLSFIGILFVLYVITVYLSTKWRFKLEKTENLQRNNYCESLPSKNQDPITVNEESGDLLHKLRHLQSILSAMLHTTQEQFLPTNSSIDAIFDDVWWEDLEDALQEALDGVKSRNGEDLTEDMLDGSDQESNQGALEVLENVEEECKETLEALDGVTNRICEDLKEDIKDGGDQESNQFASAALENTEEQCKETMDPLDGVKNRKCEHLKEDMLDGGDHELNQNALEVLENTEAQCNQTLPLQSTSSSAHNSEEDLNIPSGHEEMEDTNPEDSTNLQDTTALESDLMKETQNQIPKIAQKFGNEGRTLILQIDFNKIVKLA